MNDTIHLILGGSGGIGSALARRLAQRGATPILFARGEPRLEALATELSGEAWPGDATDPDAVQAAVAGVLERHGRLDGVACCVGSIVLKPAHRTSPAELDEVLDLNLRTAFNTVRAASQPMSRAGTGSIALLSSVAASVGLPNHEAIAAAKAGVEGLARAAAASYAPRGVRVHAVAPGLVETELAAPLLRSEAARQASEALHPLGRIGQPDEVAAVLEWLLDPASGWVTGQVIGVDGGLGRVRGRS